MIKWLLILLPISKIVGESDSQSHCQINIIMNPNQQRYQEEPDEGFERPQTHEVSLYEEMTLARHVNCNMVQKTHQNSVSINRQKPMLKFLPLERQRRHVSGFAKQTTIESSDSDEIQLQEAKPNDTQTHKGSHKPRFNIRSSQVSIDQYRHEMVIETSRSDIGLNLSLREPYSEQHRAKQLTALCQASYELSYEEMRDPSTHSYYIRIGSATFLVSKYNALLRKKMAMTTKIPLPLKKVASCKEITFNGDFQSGNLGFVFRVSDNDYNLYLRNDTNSIGHQNWFYFTMKNNSNDRRTIKLSICNLKRSFKMTKVGQMVHVKRNTDWQILPSKVETVPVVHGNGSNLPPRYYKMSFVCEMQPNEELALSLIPPYTYSDMLTYLHTLQHSKNVSINILTYSVTGLAIPIITICNKKGFFSDADADKHKKVYLISCRVHPSETCSSFVLQGLINTLLDDKRRGKELQQFLNKSILKIIPMLNPDGVVFGNFRTGFLGDDLNRVFGSTDESIHPQICALKGLGQQLKEAYGDNFVCMLDIHGHSSERNIFSYGPEYSSNSSRYENCRILPKIMSKYSRYYRYGASSFRLQDYKQDTARGYFVKRINVMAYTIETSYGLYDKEEGVGRFGQKEWRQFGEQLALSLGHYAGYLLEMERGKQISQRNLKESSKQGTTLPLDLQNVKANSGFFRKIKRQIRQQTKQQQQQQYHHEASEKQHRQKQLRLDDKQKQNRQDSDCDSTSDDLPSREKQLLFRRVRELSNPCYMLPRVLHPAIVHPEVLPASDQCFARNIDKMPRLNKLRRSKHENVKCFNVNSEYTQYLLKNIKGLGALKPNILQLSNLRKIRPLALQTSQPD